MTVEQWIKDEHGTISSAKLAELRRVVEEESALVIEHRFFKGSRAPHRFVCDDADSLAEYVRSKALVGDAFYFWRFEDCCSEKNVAISGKIPDADGRIPIGGAY